MNTINKLFLLLLLCVTAMQINAKEVEIQSLRGNYDLDELSPEPEIKRRRDSDRVKRQFGLQPPVIPHLTKGYKINLKFNKCLTCHSWENVKKTDAPRVGFSHFVDREGANSKKVAGRRYFCVQCHVTQADTPALIENTFKPANK